MPGGTAYAANTIFSTDIVDGQVKVADIATGAVRTAEIRNGQVRTPDIFNAAVTANKLAVEAPQTVQPATVDSCGPTPELGHFCSTPSGQWANGDLSGTSYEQATFLKDPAGFVHLQGTVECYDSDARCDDNDTIFILPPGYRPASHLMLGTDGEYLSEILHTRVDVGPDGKVVWVAELGGSSGSDPRSYISLSGLSFHASQ